MPGRFRSCAPIRIFGPFVCSRAIMRQASFLHGEWICRCARCHAAVRHVSCSSRFWPSCAQCGQEDTRGLLFTDVHHNWLGFLSRCALRGIRTFARVERPLSVLEFSPAHNVRHSTLARRALSSRK
jgi:hypothetical protein